MKELKLIENAPFHINGTWTFPKLETIFEVIDEKEIPFVGKMYKVRYKKFPTLEIKGFHNPDMFEEIV